MSLKGRFGVFRSSYAILDVDRLKDRFTRLFNYQVINAGLESGGS